MVGLGRPTLWAGKWPDIQPFWLRHGLEDVYSVLTVNLDAIVELMYKPRRLGREDWVRRRTNIPAYALWIGADAATTNKRGDYRRARLRDFLRGLAQGVGAPVRASWRLGSE